MAISALANDALLSDVPVEHGYKVLGGVVLYQKLGQGGMGSVYRGTHVRLGVDVALKVMSMPTGASSAQVDNFIQRFVREAKTAAAVKHSNLIRVYDVNAEHGLYYLIMDYVDGESAGARLDRKGRLGEKEALQLCLGAAEGLGGAHAKSIVHRDVKPDNILVDKEGNVVVADLGLAKAHTQGEDSALSMGISMSHEAMGTPIYMSPEQTRSAKEAGPQSDVWSLGITLQHLLTGERPWNSTDVAEIIMEIRNEEPKDLAESGVEVSEGTIALVRKATRKDPAERFADCREMAAEIRKQIETLGGGGKELLTDEGTGSTVMVLVSDDPPDSKTLTFIGNSLVERERQGAAARKPSAVETAATSLQPGARRRKPLLFPAALGGIVAAAVIVALLLVGGAPDETPVATSLRDRAMAEKARVEREAARLLKSEYVPGEPAARESYATVGAALEAGEYVAAMASVEQALAKATTEEDTAALTTMAKWCFLKRFEQLEELAEWAPAEKLAEATRPTHPDSALVEYLHQKAQAENISPRAKELLAEGRDATDQKRFDDALAAYAEVRPLLNEYHVKELDELEAACKAEAFKHYYAEAKRAFGEEKWIECLEFVAKAEACKAGNPLVADLKGKAVAACLDDLGAELEAHIEAGRWKEARALLAHAAELGVDVTAITGYAQIKAALDRRDAYERLLAEALEAAGRGAWSAVLKAVAEARKLFPDEQLPKDVAAAVEKANAALAKARSDEDDAAFARAMAVGAAVDDDAAEAVAALAAYIEEYPVGRHVDEARAATKAVRDRADDNAFAKARKAAADAGDDIDAAIAAYAAYLQGHPKGRHAEEAQSAIGKLGRAKDDAAYARAQAAASAARETSIAVAAYAGYLAKYPDGLHAAEARARIAALREGGPAERARAIREALSRGAWEDAERLLAEALAAFPGDATLASLRDANRTNFEMQKKAPRTLGIEMRWVPGCAFTMGSDDGDADEAPPCRVEVDGFYIGTFEVTNAQYEQFEPAHRRRRSDVSTGEECAAVNVSWKDAVAFCEWLGRRDGGAYRLPTEAEWELAARGTDGRTFPWGADVPDPERRLANWGQGETKESWGADGHTYVAPVGSFPKGRSPCGCQDMAGNVWEWCADWYAERRTVAGDGGARPGGPETGTLKVIKGGCWFHNAASMRCANRSRRKPTIRSDLIGFRVVMEAGR